MPRLLSVATALVAVLLLTALSGVARADTVLLCEPYNLSGKPADVIQQQ